MIGILRAHLPDQAPEAKWVEEHLSAPSLRISLGLRHETDIQTPTVRHSVHAQRQKVRYEGDSYSKHLDTESFEAQH